MADPPLTLVAARGAWGTVEFIIRGSGSCPANEFLNGECEDIREGGKGDLESTARARFAVLFRQMANYGNVSPKRFKKEMGEFFAFRHEVSKVQIRFPCFADGAKWLVTHGFCKRGAKKGLGRWPDSEVNRAKEIRGEYLTRKAKGRR